MLALRNADAAGDTEAAMRIAAMIRAQSGSIPPASEQVGGLENLAAMYGRGVAELGQGIKQLGLHAGGALGLADPATVSAYDQKVRDEAELYEKDLGQKPGGSVIPMAAQIITAAPVGGVEAAAAKEALPLANAAVRSAAVGAATGAVQPVTDVRRQKTLTDLVTGAQPEGSDYLSTKLLQVGLGGALGAAAQPVMSGLGRVVEMALPSNATKALLNVASKREQAVNPEFAKESERLADETGVMFTPSQVTGSKPGQMAENAARQSIFSRGIANEGDRARINQLKDYYDKTIGGISQSDASPEIVGNQVRAATNNVIKGLQDWRDKTAAEDFGKVRSMAKGAQLIEPKEYGATLNALRDQFGGAPKSSDYARIDGALGDLLDGLKSQADVGNLMKTRRFLSQVSAGQANIAPDTARGAQKMVATQLLKAIDNDINASADRIGGDLGGALKLANTRYGELSQQMDSVKASPLGKLLGQDVAGAMQAGEFNTLAPEKVAERLYTMKPSELRTVRGLLEQDQPEAWQAIKAGYLQNAMEKAQMQAPSEGANVSTFVPSKLVGALTPDQYSAQRLSALFDPKELSQINNIVGAGRRLGDKTGYNFSGTAPMGEALGFMNQIKEGAKQGLTMAALKTTASAVSPILGTRALARAMTDSQGRAALLELQRLPAGSAQARQISAWLAANYGAEQP